MKLALVAAVAAVALVAVQAAPAGGNSIQANPASPTTATGVWFTVTGGSGNRDFASVAVNCKDGAGTAVYSTVLTVQLDASGVGTSQTIYPPASTCAADLEKQMSIGKARVLATTPFVVASSP